MAERTQVELELVAITKEAKKSVDKFTKDTQSQLSSISFAGTVTAISTGFLAIKSAAESAFSAVSATIGHAINEAAEAEAANFRLANSLRLIGGYSEEAMHDFAELASTIQDTTAYSDDAVIAAAGLAKGFQLTNKEVKDLLPVAADLASFLGTDLNTAAQSLARTFNGDIDKAIAKNIKGLKGLSDAQLNAGEAVRIIGERVKGTASAFSGTFLGAVDQFKNSFNDVFEEFGNAIIKTPELIATIRALGAQFGILAKFIAENAGIMSDFVALGIQATTGLVAGLALVTKGAANVVAVLAALVKTIIDPLLEGAKAVYEIVKAIYTLGKTAGDAEEQFKKFFSTLNPMNFFKQAEINKGVNDDVFDPIIFGAAEVAKAAKDAARQIGDVQKQANKPVAEGDLAALRASQKEREKILQEFESKRKEITQLGLSEVQKLEKQTAETGLLIVKARNLGIIKSDRERDELLISLQKDTSEKMVKLKKEEMDRIRAETQKFADGPANAIAGALSSGSSITMQQGIAAGAGFLKGVLQGAEGAKQAISSVLGAAADAIIPGIGGVVSEIVGVLAQGPEKTKQMVEEFARAIPQIIENLVAALPVLIETLARELPPALAKTMPMVAFSFSTALIKNIPNIVKGFTQGLIDAAKAAGQALIDAVKDVFKGVGNGITGSGDSDSIFAGIPVLQGIGDFFGFAEGGRVPDISAYRGDRFPARLNAGEQVLDRDLSAELERYLDNGGGGRGSDQPLQVTINIGYDQLASVLLNMNRLGYRTGFSNG